VYLVGKSEDIKGVFRSCIYKDRHCNIQQEKGQKGKQLSTKHYKEN